MSKVREVSIGGVAHLMLEMGNITGELYDNYNQKSVITLAISNPIPGGWSLISIVANGSAITIPSTWIKSGGDDVSIVDGTTNHLSVFYKDSDTIFYTNTTVAP